MLRLHASTFTLRPWALSDVASVTKLANNRNIWRNLRDVFPHPYTETDAIEWLQARDNPTEEGLYLAIDVDGQAVGGVACRLQNDVECRTGDIGYWLGEPYWGRGIVTEAVQILTEYIFDDLDLVRLQASVFAWNPASGRVLEKAGYQLEGHLKKAAFKDGQFVDKLVYAKIKPESALQDGLRAALTGVAQHGAISETTRGSSDSSPLPLVVSEMDSLGTL